MVGLPRMAGLAGAMAGLVLAAGPASGGTGAQAVAGEALACLESLPFGDEAGFQACVNGFSEACWRAGSDMLDKAPQTACLRGIEAAVAARAAPVLERGAAETAGHGDRVRAAALTRAFAVAGAECAFEREVGMRPGGTEADGDFAEAGCRAIYSAAAYWRILIHDRVR